jgi:hypothetical protein
MVVVFYCTTIVFSSLLFFFRTLAVFKGYRWVIAFFAAMWVAVLGGCLPFVIFILKPLGPPPPSQSNVPICLNSGINPYAVAASIVPLINDTLIFLAISWRLSRISYDPLSLQGGFRFMIFGDYLPVFTRALLRDGQIYYLLATFLIYVSSF